MFLNLSNWALRMEYMMRMSHKHIYRQPTLVHVPAAVMAPRRRFYRHQAR